MVWLEKELQGSFIVGTDIFRIALSGEDPQEVTLIVNTVKDVFYNQFVKNSKQEQADQFANIEKVMVQTEEKIRIMRGDLRKLAETLKTGDTQVLTIRQKMALEEYGSMKRELSTLEAETRPDRCTTRRASAGSSRPLKLRRFHRKCSRSFWSVKSLCAKGEVRRLPALRANFPLKGIPQVAYGLQSVRLAELQTGLQTARPPGQGKSGCPAGGHGKSSGPLEGPVAQQPRPSREQVEGVERAASRRRGPGEAVGQGSGQNRTWLVRNRIPAQRNRRSGLDSQKTARGKRAAWKSRNSTTKKRS